MRLSRDQTLASGNDARRWMVRLVLATSGVALLFFSMVIGLFFLVVGALNEAVNLLLMVAAKAVKPRKLEND
ncbi:MAG: hypothetical protein P4L99_04990 [Chthoniobacter sp.]|nr:hypothetical protein [Chthoniobacter sp.]